MLTQEESFLLNDALSVYLQMASAQMPETEVSKIQDMFRNILTKIAKLQTGDENSNSPDGINDEWFDNVCVGCKDLNGNQCKQGVTKKYPGKCDPILHYERNKFLLQLKQEIDSAQEN